MSTGYPSKSINDALSAAQGYGAPVQKFLENVSFTQQNATPYIYSSLFHENEQLAKQLIEQHTVNTTNNKKSAYEEEMIVGVQWVIPYMMWIYYGVSVLLMMVLFFHGQVQGIFLLILLGLVLYYYPVWSLWIEMMLLLVWRWIASVFFGNPFVFPQQLFVFQKPMGDKLL